MKPKGEDMPKNYVNQGEREVIGITHIMMSKARDEYAAKDFLDKDERRYLRTAVTYWEKFLGKWLDRVGNKEGSKILKDMDNYQVRYFTGDRPNTIQVTTDVAKVFTQISELALCPSCINPDRVNCNIRDLLVALDSPVVSDHKCVFYPVDKD